MEVVTMKDAFEDNFLRPELVNRMSEFLYGPWVDPPQALYPVTLEFRKFLMNRAICGDFKTYLRLGNDGLKLNGEGERVCTDSYFWYGIKDGKKCLSTSGPEFERWMSENGIIARFISIVLPGGIIAIPWVEIQWELNSLFYKVTSIANNLQSRDFKREWEIITGVILSKRMGWDSWSCRFINNPKQKVLKSGFKNMGFVTVSKPGILYIFWRKDVKNPV